VDFAAVLCDNRDTSRFLALSLKKEKKKKKGMQANQRQAKH